MTSRNMRRGRLWVLFPVASVFIAACHAALPVTTPEKPIFGVVAHQGGRGLWYEESVAAFKNALDVGVSALNVDVVLTEPGGTPEHEGYYDGAVLAWGDLSVDPGKCSGGHAGEAFKDITFAQVRTLVCDRPSARFPEQQQPSDNRIALLAQVFDLLDEKSKIKFNVEIRTEPGNALSSTPERSVALVLGEVERYRREQQVTIQSFDWRNLALVKEKNPKIPLVALYDARTFFAGSPWLGPVDYNAVGGDPVKAAQKLGATVLSPDATLVDKALVERAHAAGLAVIPWTVDDKDAMGALIELGVDGIVTDYPDRMDEVLRAKGREAPGKYYPPVSRTVYRDPNAPAAN